MNWVAAKTNSMTGFELFILENFGTRIDLSNNFEFAVAGLLILMVPFFFVGWSSFRGR